MSQIPSLSNYVTTNTNQNISAIKTLTGSSSIIGNSGTVSLPVFAVGAGDIGLYSSAANTLNFSTSATNRLSIDTANIISTLAIKHPDGTNALPSITFSTDQNTGFYMPASGVIGLTVSTIDVMGFTSSRAVLMAGTVTTPSLGFSSDTTTGFYRSAANEISITNSGVNTATFSNTGLSITNATQSTSDSTGCLVCAGGLGVQKDSYFTGVANFNGVVYYNAAANYNAACAIGPTGSFTMSSGSGIASISYGGLSSIALTLPTTAGALALFSQIPTNSTYVDLTNAQNISGIKTLTSSGAIIGSNSGTASNPVFSVGGTSTGMYSSGSQILNFATNGVSRLAISNTNVSSTLAFKNQDGTNSLPAMTFTNDTASGMYLVAANNPAISAQATKITSYTSTKSSVAVDGSAATPSFGFLSDTATGFYRPTTNQIGMSINGTNLITYSSTGAIIAGNIESNAGFYIGNKNFNGQIDSVVVGAKTNSATGTACVQICPSTSGWSTGGTAKLMFGDANHAIQAVNGTGMTIQDSDGIHLGSSGSSFKNVRYLNQSVGTGSQPQVVTVAHGLPSTPGYASAIVDKSAFGTTNDSFSCTIRSKDGTNIVFEVWRTDNNTTWTNNYTLLVNVAN